MTSAEARAARFEKASLFRALRHQGLTSREIGERYGISGTWVRHLIREFFQPEPLAETRQKMPSLDRPEWSRPSPELLAQVRAIRSEIIEAEGFERARL